MRHLRFYKETDQWFEERWYVDLPEWTGSKADLEMVSGADSMLDIMSEGSWQIFVSIDDKPFHNADELTFLRMADDLNNGAYYLLEKYSGIALSREIWLCDVVKFIFNKFPHKIYIAKT